MCNHAHKMQKHSFWNSPKSLSRNEINKDRRLSLNCSKSRTCTIFTMPVLFPKKNENFMWCVSFFREYTYLSSMQSLSLFWQSFSHSRKLVRRPFVFLYIVISIAETDATSQKVFTDCGVFGCFSQ